MAIVAQISSQTPEIFGPTRLSGPLTPSCFSFQTRPSSPVPRISKTQNSLGLCVAHFHLSPPSITKPTRAASLSSRRQWHCVVRVVRSASLAEAPKTVVEEELVEQKMLYSNQIQDVVDDKTKNHHHRLIMSMATVVSSLMVSFPAFAGAGMTNAEWIYFWIAWAVIAFMYLFVIPLFLYNYLRLRWYKRNLPEAFLQFGLIFIFFPGLLLWAPFINFRRFPKNNAKEPWDDPRSL